MHLSLIEDGHATLSFTAEDCLRIAKLLYLAGPSGSHDGRMATEFASVYATAFEVAGAAVAAQTLSDSDAPRTLDGIRAAVGPLWGERSFERSRYEKREQAADRLRQVGG